MKAARKKPPLYHLEVNLRLKDSPEPWKWEIYAEGNRFFVAQSEDGFAGRGEAVEAGQRALARWIVPADQEK